MPASLYVSRAALHFWEEPSISGTRGSGTIFFCGCSLGCVFCQNREISKGISGKKITVDRLAGIMLELERQGAHNVNLVTPTHYAPSVIEAVKIARDEGLKLPIVYNTGSYDTEETIRALEGTVDVYLPDMKYFLERTAKKYSNAEKYPEAAKRAIAEMVRQTGAPDFNKEGVLTRGTVVRILLLPGHVAEAKLSLKYLYDTFGDKIYVSLMNQYTPMKGVSAPLDRTVTREEYRQLTEYAERLGLTQGYVQEFGTARESFIPPFDNTGI